MRQIHLPSPAVGQRQPRRQSVGALQVVSINSAIDCRACKYGKVELSRALVGEQGCFDMPSGVTGWSR
jgi:hypothetical protein